MKKLSVKKAVVAALEKLGSASAKSLASYTKKPYAQVATELWKLKKAGTVKNIDGAYTLSADNKFVAKAKKALEVPVKLEGAPAKISEDDEHIDSDELAHTAYYMGKFLDAQAVIKYLEAKLAKRDVHA